MSVKRKGKNRYVRKYGTGAGGDSYAVYERKPRRPAMPSETRKFDKSKFTLWYSNVMLTDVLGGKKRPAEKHASRLRESGYKVRVVKVKHGYAVYKGPKKNGGRKKNNVRN